MGSYKEIASKEQYSSLVQKLGFENFILKYFIEDDDGDSWCPSVMKNIKGFEHFISHAHNDCIGCEFNGQYDLDEIEYGSREARRRKDDFVNCHRCCYEKLNFKRTNIEEY